MRSCKPSKIMKYVLPVALAAYGFLTGGCGSTGLMGSTDMSGMAFSKQYDTDRVSAVAGFNEDNLEGRVVFEKEKEGIDLNQFELSGSRYEEETANQTIVRNKGRISKNIPLIEATDYLGVRVKASLDNISNSVTEGNVSVNADTKINGAGVEVEWVPYQKGFGVRVGYGVENGDTDLTINTPVSTTTNRYESKAKKFNVGFEATKISGADNYAWGIDVVYNSGEGVESTAEGNLWGVADLSNNTFVGGSVSKTDEDGVTGSIVVGKSTAPFKPLQSLRRSLKDKSLEDSLGRLGINTGFDFGSITNSEGVNMLTASFGDDVFGVSLMQGKAWRVGDTTVSAYYEIIVSEDNDDEVEFGGSLGVIITK